MLALADPPQAQPKSVLGLKCSPEWHREQERLERAYLDAHIRWHLKHRLPLLEEGPR